MKLFFVLALLSIAPFSAVARDEVKLPQWTIIAEESSLHFEATQMGADFEGVFQKFDGVIYFDPALGVQGFYVDIKIHTVSVDTQSADRDKYIHEDLWLDTKTYPMAVFKADQFDHVQDNQYIAHGNLTIRDVTLPVDLPFTLTITEDGQSAHAVGGTSISRLDFGVGRDGWADTETVEEMVKIKIDLKAHRDSGL